MLRLLLPHLGHHLFKNSGAARVLDWKLGLRLLRDRRVPVATKFLSLALGVGALLVIQGLELPLETALAFLVPFLGLAADVAIEGVELVAVPFFVAALLLPSLAPREVVAELRGEIEPQVAPIPGVPPRSSGFGPGNVYDASGATIR